MESHSSTSRPLQTMRILKNSREKLEKKKVSIALEARSLGLQDRSAPTSPPLLKQIFINSRRVVYQIQIHQVLGSAS